MKKYKDPNQTNSTPLMTGFKRKWAEVLFLIVMYAAIIASVMILFMSSHQNCVKDASEPSCILQDDSVAVPPIHNPDEFNDLRWEHMK
jgi:hypothetical protein